MKKYYIYIGITLFCFSCNKEDLTKSQEQEVVRDIANNILIPTISEFEQNCIDLESTISVYESDLSETNLENVRNQWIQVAKSYSGVYAFEIGDVRRQFYRKRLNDWPTFVPAIESFLDDNETINQDVFDGFGFNGIPDIEYLLFSESDLLEANLLFTDSPNAKRLNYLKFSAEKLTNTSQSLKNIWDINGENYITTIIENDDTGIRSSFSMIFNAINNIIGVAYKKKINSKYIQAPFSKMSKEILLEDLKIIESLFFNTQGLNIASYLNSKSGSTDLSNSLQEKISECKKKITDMDTSLYEALKNKTESAEDLKESFYILYRFFQIEVRNIFDTTITGIDVEGDL